MLQDMLRELKQVVITDRDIEIFRFLNEQKFMVAGQIYEAFWPKSDVSSGTARQRLTKLVSAGYIKVTDVPRDKKDKVRLFLLTEKGIEVLKGKGLDHGFAEIQTPNPYTIEHTLKLAAIRCVFRDLGETAWRSERLIRKEDEKREFFPDAILEIRGRKTAIELENSFRQREKYVARFGKYIKLFEFDLVIYVLSWTMVKDWLLNIEAPQDMFCFVLYDELLSKRRDAKLVNKTSRITLGSLLG